MLIPTLFKSVIIDRAISLFIRVLVVAMFPIRAECKKIEAPNINKLYRLIQGRPDLKNRDAMIELSANHAS
jgi:hypothetical protein